MKFILGIDQGTTSTTVILIDEKLRIAGRHSAELPQHYPQAGWVEHNPEEIWETVCQTVRGALNSAGVSGKEVEAIGITNQRETTILWDKETDKPLHNAIVWQCRRTAEICEELKKKGLEEIFRKRTGLLLDPYFSGTKIMWLLRNSDVIRKKVAEGRVAFGTVDSFLLWKLTGGKVHATDPSNASRTLIFSIEDMKWDRELCNIMEIPAQILPEVKPNFSTFGKTRGLDFLPDGIPISAMAGDQQAALYGQACFKRDEAKCTYGTGAFLLINTGSELVRSRNGLVSSVGWQKRDGSVTYVLEGSSFTAGSAVQWLRDSLGIILKASEIEELAKNADSRSGVLFVPALTGLGAPYWDPEARGAIFGLTRKTGKSEIARGVLEGIALQVRDLCSAMEDDTQRKIVSFKVDGGACVNNLLMKIQADFLGISIVRPQIVETTSLGVAMMAGLEAGVFKSEEELLNSWKFDRVFEPQMSDEERNFIINRWNSGIKAVRSFAKKMESN